MNYSVTGEQLTAIADAIRAKTGGTAQLEFPTEFVSEIGNIGLTEGTTNVSIPSSSGLIPAYYATGMGSVTINNLKAVKSITITGVPSNCYFTYVISTNKITFYIVNNSDSMKTINANSISVTVTYYT